MTVQQITCKDCRTEFAFTDAEREFYESKGLAVPPKRCKACRQARKAGEGVGRSVGRDGPSRAPRSGPRAEMSRGPAGGRPERRGGRPAERRPFGEARTSVNPMPAVRVAPRSHAATKPEPAAPAPRARPERPKYDITCATCGAGAQVPFKPLEGRQIYCQPCYRARAGLPKDVGPILQVGAPDAGVADVGEIVE